MAVVGTDTYDCLLTQFFFHWLEQFKKLAKDNLNSYVVPTFGDKIVIKTTCIVYTGVNFFFQTDSLIGFDSTAGFSVISLF